jgi:hypothetical protein
MPCWAQEVRSKTPEIIEKSAIFFPIAELNKDFKPRFVLSSFSYVDIFGRPSGKARRALPGVADAPGWALHAPIPPN